MYQRITLIGNVGKDPELKFLPSGKALCNFTLATNERKKDLDGVVTDSTVWWRVTAWGNTAEAVNKYAKKGSKLLIEGKLYADQSGNPRVFQRQDGTWSANYEMNADVVRFVETKREEGGDDEFPY